MQPRLIVVDVNHLENLTQQDRKALIQFLHSKERTIESLELHSYVDPATQELYEFIFHHPLIKKQDRQDIQPGKYFVIGETLGQGEYGRVLSGGGTLRFTENELYFKQTLHCDFIYINPTINWSLDKILDQCQSKTAFALIQNHLFYLDKATYLPWSVIHYVADLSNNQLRMIRDQFQFSELCTTIQSKSKLNEEEIDYFLPYYSEQSQKNYVIKCMQHNAKRPTDRAHREANLMCFTPHLGKIRLYFTINNAASFTKINKKPSQTLDTIMQYPLSDSELIQLTDQLFGVLESQVSNPGLVHRDLKPENIMVDLETMTVFIIDYGLSKQKSDHTSWENVGNIAYGSPEQMLNQLTDERADSYALGKIIGELWGLLNNHERNLPKDQEEMLKRMKYNITHFDAEFFLPQHVRIQNDNLYKALIPILNQLCIAEPDDRISLTEARRQFRDINEVKQHLLPDFKYIMDEITKNKLLKLCSPNTPQFNLFKISNQWQQNARNNHFSKINFLYALAADNQIKSIQRLLEEKIIDTEEVIRDGLNILCYAIYHRKEALIDLLSNFNVNINSVSHMKLSRFLWTMNDFAKRFNRHHQMDLLFYLYGIKHSRTIQVTPIHFAICLGYERIVRDLLNKGADLNALMGGKASGWILEYFCANPVISNIIENTISDEVKTIRRQHKYLIDMIQSIGKFDPKDNVFKYYEQSNAAYYSPILDFSKSMLRNEIENEAAREKIESLLSAPTQMSLRIEQVQKALLKLHTELKSGPSFRC